jgi:hypothetical protein
MSGFLALFSMVIMVVWVSQADGVGWPQGMGVTSSLAMSFWLGWQWWHSPTGFLSWDGQVWTWAVNNQTIVVVPELEIDLQHWVLLRLCSAVDSTQAWVGLERSFAPTRWLALRRAVFHSPRLKTLAGTDPTGLTPDTIGRVT